MFGQNLEGIINFYIKFEIFISKYVV